MDEEESLWFDRILSRWVDPADPNSSFRSSRAFRGTKNLTIKKLALKFFRELEKNIEARILITSGAEVEAKHEINSLHYKGRAIDFVLIGDNGKELYEKEIAFIVHRIARKYHLDVLDEYAIPSNLSSGGHFHVEYSVDS